MKQDYTAPRVKVDNNYRHYPDMKTSTLVYLLHIFCWSFFLCIIATFQQHQLVSSTNIVSMVLSSSLPYKNAHVKRPHLYIFKFFLDYISQMSTILNNCKFLQYLDTKQEYLLENCHVLLHSVFFKLCQLLLGNP